MPGNDGRNRQNAVGRKIRADRIVTPYAAAESLRLDFSNVQPLHQQGETWVHNDVGETVALTVGADGQVLRADSATSEGVAWTLDPSTLLTQTGGLLTFEALPSPGQYVALNHPGSTRQGYALTSGDNTVSGSPGLQWQLPVHLPVGAPASTPLPVRAAFTVANTGGDIALTGSTGTPIGSLTIQGMYVSPKFFRIEIATSAGITTPGTASTVRFNPFASATGPFPNPLARVDKSFTYTIGSAFTDAFAVVTTSTGIVLTPTAHDITATWTASTLFVPQPMAIEYQIA